MAEKVIRDPLYGFISLEKDELALKLIDTPEFQRLKHIRQLGVSFVTYPGANHTRFSHSLGVYHLSQKLYDILGRKDDSNGEKVSIAALLHDIGHSPLSHAFESVLTPGINHEEWTKLIINDSATTINEEISNSIFTPKEISDLIIKPSNPTFLHTMISSQLDVDRFDFLQRDSLFTGNPSGKFDIKRVLRTLQLSDDEDDLYVQTKGLHSVEGYLISRYHMYNQVYMHPTTVCCEGLLKNIFKLASDLTTSGDLNPPTTLEKALKHETLSVNEFVQLTDNDVFYALGLWKNAQHVELNDLCRRLLTRKLLKPIKNINIKNYFNNKDDIEGILKSNGFNPNYYLVWIEGSEKSAYNPYSPDPVDQLNAIIVEGNRDISEKLPNLKYLGIGTENIMGVPEECKDDITGIIMPENK